MADASATCRGDGVGCIYISGRQCVCRGDGVRADGSTLHAIEAPRRRHGRRADAIDAIQTWSREDAIDATHFNADSVPMWSTRIQKWNILGLLKWPW